MAGGAQCFLAFGQTARDGDDFGCYALFAQAHGFLDGDLIEGVDARFNIGGVHTRVVRLDAGLHAVVHHAFDGNEDFH